MEKLTFNEATAAVLAAFSIRQIAIAVRNDWADKVYFGAKPYLEAMLSLEKISDNYGADSGAEIVMYFLSNATTYRGDIARLVKAELKARLKKAR